MSEQIESSESSHYEKDRLAWNLPVPRRILSPAESKEDGPSDDDTDDADEGERPSLKPAA